MVKSIQFFLFLTLLSSFSCKKKEVVAKLENQNPVEFKGQIDIHYNAVEVALIVDKPALDTVDVSLLFHGTVMTDDKIIEAAHNTLNAYKAIIESKEMMLVSVAYPEQGLLFGDNIKHAEAALLWVKEKAEQELKMKVRKIFLSGHSQGGYLVTRLNTMHKTDGVIANAPGPLDLVYRCGKEEDGSIPKGAVCSILKANYGETTNNPDAYMKRSLLNFTSAHKSKILFVQGLKDENAIHLFTWPIFKDTLLKCNNCEEVKFLELENLGHNSLFNSLEAKQVFNAFLNE